MGTSVQPPMPQNTLKTRSSFLPNRQQITTKLTSDATRPTSLRFFPAILRLKLSWALGVVHVEHDRYQKSVGKILVRDDIGFGGMYDTSSCLTHKKQSQQAAKRYGARSLGGLVSIR